MNSPVALGRIAGLLYLLIIVFGLTSELAFRAPAMAGTGAGDALDHLLRHRTGLRSSVVLDLAMLICDVTLAAILLILFRRGFPILILLSTLFRLLQDAVLSANLLNILKALVLLDSATDSGGAHAALQSLQAFQSGYDLGLIFFAFSCLFLAMIFLSGSPSPKSIGVALLLSALVYLSGSLTAFLAPVHSALVAPFYLIPILTESALCVWLLKGRGIIALTNKVQFSGTGQK